MLELYRVFVIVEFIGFRHSSEIPSHDIYAWGSRTRGLTRTCFCPANFFSLLTADCCPYSTKIFDPARNFS